MEYSQVNLDMDKNMKFALGFKFHVIFWIVILTYYFYSMNLFNIPFEFALRSKMFYFPFQLVAAYVMLFVLLGKFLYKGRYLIAVFGFLIFIFFLSYIATFLSSWVANPYFDPEYIKPTLTSILMDIENLISQPMRIIFISPMILICLEFAASQYQKMQDVNDLLLLKDKTELDLLKTQIHPGFLLSTLRNLESLTKDEDENGPVVIEKLSEVLDYILYKGRQYKIEIQEELKVLNEYISLETTRFQGVLDLDFSYSNIGPNDLISPLILFSFLELNFKEYSRSNLPFAACKIEFKKIDNTLDCKISNLKIINDNSDFINYDLNKMKRQLDISYPNMYTISIENESDYYNIHLRIEL